MLTNSIQEHKQILKTRALRYPSGSRSLGLLIEYSTYNKPSLRDVEGYNVIGR